MTMVWLYYLVSYIVGNIMFGFLVSKLLKGQDIREHGSGNVGARNAGRVYGKKAFVLTFLGDALKGAAVVLAGRYLLHFSEIVQMIGLVFVIVGHLKPIVLRFKGGMGISTFIGGIIAFEPLLASVIVLAFLVLYPFFKSFTFAGLGSFLFIPLFLVINTNNWVIPAIASGIILLLILAHIVNIKERIKK
ncbi:glycerol-3-phosphate acyltransferase [Neobacillus rhizophilus]|uniref:Glycerol-3-phosphate acyltransferase n=1 Tax=Neobacillus rhizophilus TaxID=2833579 RepID=A0A942YUN9_9BACI|nr:glycerol-3-phosphate acyltransferase [Neobacillus rhizophilus]MBS4213087.1 glycerol-3-phosphate acyltransferase [Neobacillus rhizophilus]MBU8914790.1 glycerol-3-phosphate acyltransferase [Bacillus sp. FJAT-29953]